MPINDLTNPIHVPNGLDTANDNPIAKAEKIVVTGTNETVTEALNNREDSLGNPTSDGQILSSTTTGTRSWITPASASADPRYRARIALSSTSLTITSANIDTYDGALVYLGEGYVGGVFTLNIDPNLSFHFIDFANFSGSSSSVLRINPQGGARIDGGTTDLEFNQYQGGRLVDAPNAANSYYLIFTDIDADNYVNTAGYSNGVLTLGRTGTLPDLTANIPAGEPLESLINLTGSTIPAGQPVIAVTHTDGSRRMVRPTTSNLGHNLGVNIPEAHIYGFVPQDVPHNTSATPIRQGVISNMLLLASNNQVGQEVSINRDGNTYVINDGSQSSTSYAHYVGEVIGSTDATSRYSVYLSLDFANASRESRLQEEVDGKEDGLGNPTTDGFVLSSTAAGVRSWIAQGSGGGTLSAVGTPTDGQYPQWASASTLRALDGIPSADITLSEVVVTANGLISVPNEMTYNTYANRRVLFRHSSAPAAAQKIFQLPVIGNVPGIRPAWVRTGDFFEIVNDPTVDPTRTMIVRSHNSTESIGSTDRQVTLQPNEFIRVAVPSTASSRWNVVSRGFISGASGVSGQMGSSMDSATVVTDRPDYQAPVWNMDVDGSAYRDGNVKIERIETVIPDNVIHHLTSPADTNNPIALYFDDDQSMIAWWQHIYPNQSELNLGGDYKTILSNVDDGVSWLNTNIGVNHGFELKVPEAVDLPIESFAHVSGNTIRVHVESGVADLTTIAGFEVNRPIKIEGSGVAALNDFYSLVSVSTSHFEISALDLGSTTIESDSSATVSLIWYGSVAVASTTQRQYNFNLYYDALRTSPATIGANHFDPDSDIDTVQSALDVEYNAAVERTPQLTLEDKDGTIHYVSSGTIHNLYQLDNGDPRFNPLPASDVYQSQRDIPEGSPVIHVRTEGNVILRLPPIASIPEGQSRQYRIFSDPRNATHEVTISNQAGLNHFDGTVRALQLPAGRAVDIEMYNDGENVGSRIITPINKVDSSPNIYSTPVTATTANTIPLDIDFFAGGSIQDTGYYFFNPPGSINNPNSRVQFLTEGTSYELDTRIDVLFNGTEPTGLQFADITIMPMLRRLDIGQTTYSDQPQFSTTGQLVLSRSGQTGSSAPKSRISLVNSFRRVSTLDEEWRIELRFSNLPQGVTLGDFQLQNFQFVRRALRGFI